MAGVQKIHHCFWTGISRRVTATKQIQKAAKSRSLLSVQNQMISLVKPVCKSTGVYYNMACSRKLKAANILDIPVTPTAWKYHSGWPFVSGSEQSQLDRTTLQKHANKLIVTIADTFSPILIFALRKWSSVRFPWALFPMSTVILNNRLSHNCDETSGHCPEKKLNNVIAFALHYNIFIYVEDMSLQMSLAQIVALVNWLSNCGDVIGD